MNIEDNEKILCFGLDVGTMTIILSRNDKKQSSVLRNMFLRLDDEKIDIDEIAGLNYIIENGRKYILGEDAFKMANMFNAEVYRPMEKGLISPKEIDSIDVLAILIKTLFGKIAKSKESYCSFSVPANPIDSDRNTIYHRKVFERILDETIGTKAKACNEAMAVIYSDCEKSNFSGISVCFGAGMSNVCVSYMGVEVLSFSTSKSGDWIDKNVSSNLDIRQNRITGIKEKKLNLSLGFSNEKNKKVKRILEALTHYYGEVIDYTIKMMVNRMEQKFDLEIDEKMPIVVAGGTAMVPGFLEVFATKLMNYDLPFDVSEVRMAKDPQYAVSHGLLIKTISDVKKLEV